MIRNFASQKDTEWQADLATTYDNREKLLNQDADTFLRNNCLPVNNYLWRKAGQISTASCAINVLVDKLFQTMSTNGSADSFVSVGLTLLNEVATIYSANILML